MNPEGTLNEGLQQAINAAVTNAIAPLHQENEFLHQQLEALRTSTSASTNNNPVPSMPKAPKSVPVTPFEGDQDKWDAFVTQIKLKIVEYRGWGESTILEVGGRRRRQVEDVFALEEFLRVLLCGRC